MMRHAEPMGEWVPGEEFAETLKRRLARIEEIQKAIGILEEERDHLFRCMNAKPYFIKDTSRTPEYLQRDRARKPIQNHQGNPT